MMRMIFWNKAYQQMLERYGTELPWQVLNRFEQERLLLSDKCVQMLDFLARLQAAAREAMAPVFLRGQYTASFAGYLLGASEIDPLPPHYYCPHCRKIELAAEVRDGFDLPEKVCACGAVMTANGHDIPVESLALQANHFNSIECVVPQAFLPVAEEEIRSTFGEAYDVVSVLVEEEADRIHYAMLPKGAAPTAAGGILRAAEGLDLEALPYVRIVASRTADKLQAAWHRAGELPAPQQYCEQENLRAYLLDDRELEDTFAAMPEKQSLCFSVLMRLCGLRQGIYHQKKSTEEKPMRVALLGGFPADREEIFQCIVRRMPQAAGLAVRVMNSSRKGQYAHRGMPAEVSFALKEFGVEEDLISACRQAEYLFPRAHIAESLRWRLILKWYARHGFAE